MAVLEWLLGFGGAALISLSLLVWVKNYQQERRLREAFYYLIERHDGLITLIELAASARVDAAPAKEYLDNQAKFFSALPEVDSEGNTFYRFPKMQRSLPLAEHDEWE